MNRFRKRSFGVPAPTDTFKYRSVGDTKFSRPNRQRLSLTAISQKMIGSFIHCLLASCRPATIFGAVIAVVVDSLNRKTRLIRRSHVGQEILKFVPSFADLYPATAIVVVNLALLISASLMYLCPYTVDGHARPFSFLCYAPRFRMIIGFLAIFALGAETILLRSVAIKIRSWFCGLAMTTAFGYDRFRHGSFSFAKRLCLEPGEVRPSFGSLIIEPQFYGVKP